MAHILLVQDEERGEDVWSILAHAKNADAILDEITELKKGDDPTPFIYIDTSNYFPRKATDE